MTKLRALVDALGPVCEALAVKDMCALPATITPRPTAATMLRQMTIELFITTVLRIGETIDRLVAHADRVALEPHSTCDLLWRPASLEPIFDSLLEFRVNDHLAVNGAACPERQARDMRST